MNTVEYQDTQDRLLMACVELASLPLDDFLAAIDKADAAGSVVDPTLYRAAADRLTRIRALAGGAQGMVRVFGSDVGLVHLAAQALVRPSVEPSP